MFFFGGEPHFTKSCRKFQGGNVVLPCAQAFVFEQKQFIVKVFLINNDTVISCEEEPY